MENWRNVPKALGNMDGYFPVIWSGTLDSLSFLQWAFFQSPFSGYFL